MYNVLIWGTGILYDSYLTLIRIYEEKKQFHVVGVTSNDNYYNSLDGYPFVPKENLVNLKYDWILVCASDGVIKEIREEAHAMGVAEDIILSAKILQLPDLDFGKYISLVKSKISIFTNNCWGGVVYQRLGLKVCSPFFNMAFDSDEGYLDFLKNSRHILTNEKLRFERMEYNEAGGHDYPIYSLAGILIRMLHYHSREDVEKKWCERLRRINWENIFVMMYTNDIKCMERFSLMPYDKKVCFTSLDVDVPYSYNLPLDRVCPGRQLWEIVIHSAQGQYKLYDLMDMLITGHPVNHRIQV